MNLFDTDNPCFWVALFILSIVGGALMQGALHFFSGKE